MNDGNLNDVPDSRWSCETALEGTEFECYATFDLGSSQSLIKLTIYFYKSNEEDRVTNPFVVSTSTDGTTFTTSFEDINTIPTPLGEGEDFAFPTGSSGRYVRFTGDLADDQWLSVNEVEIYVDVATPAPVAPETPAPIPPPTPVPTVTATAAPIPLNL
ncbi:hypothetical protein Esi_0212_0050 [Ectocarpus siliculosus]|uniref:F5/8 type C domain-containing protein n=1 Tax=Ectocarpus siliculosus TaxID=2880 RepID=D7FRB9_ECTSI|nr:hypothetical protein Esi_0212_0050 [Ectocarpus siliculosus]|eukprot:CBJ30710.1 hypothetical protein Esi_0212_0050 [Ectocarpus siliculosus]